MWTATTADPETFAKLEAGAGPGDSARSTIWPFRPSMFASVVQGLAKIAAAPKNARVIVEKPFGRDLASAQALDRTLA